VLGAALAGWATILPVGTPHWPVLVASPSTPASAPLSSGNAPSGDSVIVPVPAAASAAEQTPDAAATASGGTPSQALEAPVAMTAAAEMPATTGLESATQPPKPLLDDRERPRAEAAPARSRQSASPAVARAAAHAPPQRRHIVLQLSSYVDQARARQAAEKLHRSLQKILQGAVLRTEEAEVHGRRVWRVVAGPVADRERGKRLCDALHHAGQSCVVVLL
jgi:cell division septation protein DedD